MSEISKTAEGIPRPNSNQKSEIDINNWLADLNKKNLEATARNIASSPIAKYKGLTSILSDAIIKIIPVRTTEIDLLVELLKCLKNYEHNRNGLSLVMPGILKTIFDGIQEYNVMLMVERMYFVRKVVLAGLVKAADIYKIVIDFKDSRPNLAFLMLFYILPEIKSQTPKILSLVMEKMKKFRISERSIRQFQTRLDELMADNFKLLTEYLDYGVEKSSVEYILMTDDLDRFKQLAAKSDFNFEARIEDIPLVPASFVQMSPSYVEFASFYGAINIICYVFKDRKIICSPMMYAVAGAQRKLMQYYESRGLYYEKCLRIAAFYRRFDLFEEIQGKTPEKFVSLELNLSLCRAAETNDLRLIIYCLDHGAYINYTDENKETPIFLAARAGNNSIVKYLITIAGVKCDIPNMFGQTTLTVADEDTLQTIHTYAD